jgi:anti-anti-sigma factor
MSRHVGSDESLAGSITVETDGDRRILWMRGDIDSAVVARFKEDHGRVWPAIDIIDAGDVSFISSTGLAVMIRCSEAALAAGRGRPVLRSVSHATNRVLQLAGLDTALLRRAPATGDGEPRAGSTAEEPG